MSNKTSRVVSVRVPENLPAKVKAVTGLSFSKAITSFFEPFVEQLLAQQTHHGDQHDDTSGTPD